MSAHSGSMPPDIAQKLAVIGRTIAPPETAALYEPLHRLEPYPGVTIARDVSYGPDRLQALDMFTADGTTELRPVLVHVHGGAFVRGDKKTPNSPFLDNIPLWAAHNGMVGINVNYRLAPVVTWPSGAEDMAAIIRWIRNNANAHGIDPNHLVLMGSSAGGHHVASYLGHRQYHVIPGGGVAAAIFLSGVAFDTAFSDLTNYAPYFGSDSSRYAAMSPLPGLLQSSVPLMIAYTGLEPSAIERDSIHLIDQMHKAGHNPAVTFLKTHSHLSPGYSIGTDDTELTGQLLAFIQATNPVN